MYMQHIPTHLKVQCLIQHMMDCLTLTTCMPRGTLQFAVASMVTSSTSELFRVLRMPHMYWSTSSPSSWAGLLLERKRDRTSVKIRILHKNLLFRSWLKIKSKEMRGGAVKNKEIVLPLPQKLSPRILVHWYLTLELGEFLQPKLGSC